MSRNSTPDFVSVVEGVLNRLVEQEVVPGERYGEFRDLTVNTLAPQYVQQDDFTVALLNKIDTGVTLAVGVSKRNPTDARLPLRGRALALSRAVRELIVEQLGFEGQVDTNTTPVVEATLVETTPTANA